MLGVTALDAAQVVLELGQHQLRRCLQGEAELRIEFLDTLFGEMPLFFS